MLLSHSEIYLLSSLPQHAPEKESQPDLLTAVEITTAVPNSSRSLANFGFDIFLEESVWDMNRWNFVFDLPQL
jgi:hypothetical protein